jgi:hypothetical protein
MHLREAFQWLMLLYEVKHRFVDCCCKHGGEFSSRKLGAFSDLQHPLYMISGDIEKFTLVIVLSSGQSFHKWQEVAYARGYQAENKDLSRRRS